MSGSFDRPTLRRRAPIPDDLDDGTGPIELGVPARAGEREFHASRAAQADFHPTNAPIVPAGSVTGRSLTLVISIMCFLASLTAGAVYLMNQTATQWMQDMASEVTVQIETRPRVDSDRQVAEVVAFLSRQQGVAQARA